MGDGVMEIRKSGFSVFYKRQNNLAGFEGWVFLPGMGFDEKEKWWGHMGTRQTRHEGIDLCLYRDCEGRMVRVNPGSRVPAMYDGIVVAVIPDFLGHTVVLEHCFGACAPDTFYTLYAHTVVGTDLAAGSHVDQGHVVGRVADPKSSGASISAHLHISAGFPEKGLPPQNLNWTDISHRRQIALFDPTVLL
jgi:murein DD-endopeptidase MepM/ murein hydrolase activator NlpD